MNALAGLTRRLDDTDVRRAEQRTSRRLEDLYQRRIRAEEALIPSYQRSWVLSDIDYEIDGLEEDLAEIEEYDDGL